MGLEALEMKVTCSENIRNQLSIDTVSHFRILESLYTLLYW